MRKYWLLIILLLNIEVFALNIEQQDNISIYAKEMVEKGNLRISSDNTPLPKYGSGDKRLPAFKNELYDGHFVFNCDSFVSYILYHTYGFPVVKKNNEPYVVNNYESAAKKGEWIYMVTDISFEYSYDEIKDNLEKGDVILCYKNGEVVHTFLYIGDGLIAQSRRAGLTVDNFQDYADGVSYKYKIARLKEDGATKMVDMSILWPDTNEIEILGNVIDNYPYLNVYFINNNKITIVMEDDLMIDSYSINCDESNDNWIVVKQKNYALNYVVTKNSVCLIKVRDSKSQITSKKININNLVLENTFSNYQDMQVNNLINDNKDSNKSIYIIVVIIMIFVGITVILIKKGKRSSNKTKYVKNKKNHKK